MKTSKFGVVQKPKSTFSNGFAMQHSMKKFKWAGIISIQKRKLGFRVAQASEKREIVPK
jgi:hypothetical protein